MSRTRIFAILGIVLVTTAFFAVGYMRDYARVKAVLIGNSPFEAGTIPRIILTNNQPSKVEFQLACHFKVRSAGKALLSETLTLPPNGSMEFDVNPELQGRALPRMVANKACEAIWQGPFKIKRSAWWVTWSYGKPAHKVVFE
jgi:hypothetical protein